MSMNTIKDTFHDEVAVDYAIDPVDGAIQRLATGLRSSAIEEVIPFGHEAYIIELNVTKDAEEVIYQTLAEASLGIEGGLPSSSVLSEMVSQVQFQTKISP